MIVRILGEGQYTVPDEQRGALEKLDSAIVDAVDSGDEKEFASALAALTARRPPPSARSGRLPTAWRLC